MARAKLRMSSDEDSVLKNLYVEANISTDKYPLFEDELRSLANTWNTICGRSESHIDLLHYMQTERKNGNWVKIGREGSKILKNIALGLSDDELRVLDSIHEDLQISSDRFALDPLLADKLKKEFGLRTGRVFPAMQLAAIMVRRRKDNKLETLKPVVENPAKVFSDFDKVANQ